MKISLSILRFAAAVLVGIGLAAPLRAQEKADKSAHAVVSTAGDGAGSLGRRIAGMERGIGCLGQSIDDRGRDSRGRG